MKLLKLRFANINSLAGEHCISFDEHPIATSGLFLITGPTGSGKTTLLDAISLALYQFIPRIGTITVPGLNDSGYVITRGELSAFAQVEYEVRAGERYRSTWKIEGRTARAKEFSATHLKCTLEQWKNDEWVGMPIKNSDVSKVNEQLIGLSAEQFNMSIVLSQGAFAKLLHAKPDERSKLLETITGSFVYRSIGKKIAEKTRLAEAKVYDLQSKMDAIQLLKQEEVAEFEARILQLTNQIDSINHDLEPLEKIIRLKDELKNKRFQLGEKQREIQLLHKQVEATKFEREQLSRHEKAVVFQLEIEQLTNILNQHKRISDELIRVADAGEKATKEVDAILLSFNDLCGKNADRTTFEVELSELSKELNEILQEKIKLESQLSIFNDQLRIHTNILTDNHGVTNLDDDYLEKQLEELSAKLKDFDAVTASRTREKLSMQRNALVSWESNHVRLTAVEREIQEKTEQKTKLTEDATTAATKLNPCIEREKILSEKVDLLEKVVDNLRKTSSFDEIRAQLKAGEPCPVCGSKDHAIKGGTSGELNIQESLLSDARKSFDIARMERHDLMASIETTEENLNVINQHLAKLEPERNLLKATDRDFEKEFGDVGFEEGKKRVIDALDQIIAQEKAYGLFESIQTRKEIADKIKTQSTKIEKVTQKLASKYSGSDFTQDEKIWRSRFASNQQMEFQSTRKVDELNSEKRNLETELEKLKNDLLPRVHEAGFESVKSCKTFILQPADKQKIEREITAIDQKLNGAQAVAKDLEASCKTLSQADTHSTTLEDLISDKRQMMEKLQGNISERSTLQEKIVSNNLQLERSVELQSEFAESDKERNHWRTLNKAFGTESGDKFNNIAQKYTLNYLITLANARLKSFNARYSIQSVDPTDVSDKVLFIRDQQMGNQERQVTTLSGGETFLSSLALALALADFASEKIRIDCLFIDEGFGTLDPDSLETAMAAIEQLRTDSGKTVGLISHVPELKERIRCQIQLEKKGAGRSTLSVI